MDPSIYLILTPPVNTGDNQGGFSNVYNLPNGVPGSYVGPLAIDIGVWTIDPYDDPTWSVVLHVRARRGSTGTPGPWQVLPELALSKTVLDGIPVVYSDPGLGDIRVTNTVVIDGCSFTELPEIEVSIVSINLGAPNTSPPNSISFGILCATPATSPPP